MSEAQKQDKSLVQHWVQPATCGHIVHVWEPGWSKPRPAIVDGAAVGSDGSQNFVYVTVFYGGVMQYFGGIPLYRPLTDNERQQVSESGEVLVWAEWPPSPVALSISQLVVAAVAAAASVQEQTKAAKQAEAATDEADDRADAYRRAGTSTYSNNGLDDLANVR